MSFVLDASVTLAWCFLDEKRPATDALLHSAIAGGVVVPQLWHLEIANTVRLAERKGRITSAYADAFLNNLALIEIRVDGDTAAHAWGATLALARAHNLTLYDAAYLELALRRVLPLATLDAELRVAAQALALPLLGI